MVDAVSAARDAMYERFTDRSRKVMQLANQEAQRFNHEYIGTEHILLGLVQEASGVAANVLKCLDVDLRKIRLEVEKIVQLGPGGEQVLLGKLPHTPRARRVIEFAVEEALHLKHNYVGTEHLLLGLLREQEGVAAQVLMNLGLRLEEVREEVINLLVHRLDDAPANVIGNTVLSMRKAKTPTLDSFGRDLTELAGKGDLTSLIGRAAELRMVVEILTCRNRRCPLVLGEPGVGKTALVAGFARAVVDNLVPDWLRGQRIVELSLGRLRGNSIDWSQASERAHTICGEISKTRDAILFLPDLVAFLGAARDGSATRHLCTEFLLALHESRIPCIFSATPIEYQQCAEWRQPLDTISQSIILSPASADDTLAILYGLRRRYESYHKVRFNDDALSIIAESADRQLAGALPGKAVALLDRCAARARMRAFDASPRVDDRLRQFDERIEELNRLKESAVAGQDFPLAADLRTGIETAKGEKSTRQGATTGDHLGCRRQYRK